MTTTANDKEARKALLKERSEAMAAKEKELNAGKAGKGLRVFVGMTRGKNPQEVQYQGFDDEQPNTLPETLAEFMSLSKPALNDTEPSEPQIVDFLVRGFNDWSYEQASDPVAEHLNPAWPDDVKRNFRIIVRNYASNAGVSIEDAVALIKPGVEKAQAAKQ